MIGVRKERALAALLTANSITDAAEKAGISPRTMYSYLHEDEEFLRRYETAKAALLADAEAALQKRLLSAVDTLDCIMQDEGVPSGVRVQACRCILEYAVKLMEASARKEALIDERRAHALFGLL